MLNWFQGLGAAQWPGDLSTPQPMWSEPSECAQPRGTGMSAASQQLRQPHYLRFLQFLLPSVSPSWVKTKSWVLNSTLLSFFFFHSLHRHLYIILHLVLSTAKIRALGTFTSERNILGAQNPAKPVQSWVKVFIVCRLGQVCHFYKCYWYVHAENLLLAFLSAPILIRLKQVSIWFFTEIFKYFCKETNFFGYIFLICISLYFVSAYPFQGSLPNLPPCLLLPLPPTSPHRELPFCLCGLHMHPINPAGPSLLLTSSFPSQFLFYLHAPSTHL